MESQARSQKPDTCTHDLTDQQQGTCSVDHTSTQHLLSGKRKESCSICTCHARRCSYPIWTIGATRSRGPVDSTKYPSTAAGGHERRGNSGVRLRVLIQDDMQGTSSTVYLIIWDVLVKTPPPRGPPGSLSWHAFVYWRARGYTHLL